MACACVHCASVRVFFRAITCTFMHGFQTNLAVVHLDKEKCYLKHLFTYIKGQGHT